MPDEDESMFEVEYADDGRIVDFLSGVHLEETPEELVRQRYSRVLHYDYGYPKNVMRREVGIHAGSKVLTDASGLQVRADIVVYANRSACSKGDQGNIRFVVECKRPTETSGYNQLASYIFYTSAGGGVWTDGDDVQPYRRLDDGLEPAPRIPSHGEAWSSVGRPNKSSLRKPRDVRGLLRLCNNRLHGRGIDADEEDLTMDMVRILLAKSQDEIQAGDIADFYVTPEEYSSAEGRGSVAQRVQGLFRKFADNNPGVFGEHEKIGVSDDALVEVVAVLQAWQIMTRLEDADEWDVMGSAYEQYTHSHLKRARGQFFTNRLVVDFVVKALDPNSDTRALDPAGGSGGFLTAVLRHVRRKVISGAGSETAKEHQLANLRQRLYMVEISPRLVKIAKTAMLLNGDGHSGMTRGNSLGPYGDLDDWIKARCGRGTPSLILTNPPFAGVGEGQINDPAVLSMYKVAQRWDWVNGEYAPTSSDLVPCPPEMLFFERCLDWLAPGGQLGIVMPKGFLDTTTYRPARELLLSTCKLLGVINLHKNTFQPDTGVRTCVVLVRKLRTGEQVSEDHSIFMGISQRIGRDSEGRPVFAVDQNGDITEEVDHDLDEMLKSFTEAQEGELKPSENRFVISRDEIDYSTLSLNPQRYLPNLNETLRAVQRMDGADGWTVTTLSQLEHGIKVFKGPRLRTENILVEAARAEDDFVEPYFTPSAVLQDKRDSVKWLDLAKANDRQKKAFDAVRVWHGDLLVTRSGSVGRIAYIPQSLDGAIVSDDAIRVRVENPDLRAYVYAFLQSQAAQHQLKINEYGSIQQHLEPSHVQSLAIPVPDDWDRVATIIEAGKSFFAGKELLDEAQQTLRDDSANIWALNETGAAGGN